MAKDLTLTSKPEPQVVDASTGESVTLRVGPSVFASPTWTPAGTAVSPPSPHAIAVTVSAGTEAVHKVTDPSGSAATAIVRWKPNSPAIKEPASGRGTLEVRWTKVSDERYVHHYEVQLQPSPPATALTKRTTGHRGRGDTRHVRFDGLPNDFYNVKLRAVAEHPNSGEAASDWASLMKAVEVAEVSKAPRRGLRITAGVLAAIALAVAVALVIIGPRPDDDIVVLDAWTVTIGALAAFGAVMALGACVRLSVLVSGADGRVSTSKLNVALWTFTVVLALFTLASTSYGAAHFASDEKCGTTPVDNSLPDDQRDGPWVCVDGEPRDADALQIDETFEDGLAPPYLVLLGGPFVALAGAAFIVNRQVENEDRQKVQRNGIERFGDAFSNDNGDADLVDAQYLLFTAVLLFVFYLAFIRSPFELPELPWGLVGMTGISAGTFLLNKAVTTNGLTVDSLVPNVVTKGQTPTVRILGRNFLPEGSAGLPSGGVSVMFGQTATTIQSVTNTEIVVNVPLELAETSHQVTVTTAANVTGIAGDLTVRS